MDPNHWNTYNFQYGAAQSGLTPTHPSLGLSLSHGLQGAHSSISSRGVSALPSVNYTGLSVPLLESMGPLSGSIQPQQAHHKTMGISDTGQFVFDPQVRVSAEQLSPSSINRYEAGNKMLRTEGLSRNQLLEAARVWGGTNFPATSSLYNQYSAILPEVAGMSASGGTSSIPSSPGPASYTSASSKSSQPTQQQVLQEPPPAHSSSVPRITSCQRIQNVMGDLIYSRSSSESLSNPSSLSLTYASSLSGKDSTHGSGSTNHQQTTVHHRQTPAQSQAFLSPQGRDTDSLSSAAASHQLYGSYGNLSVVDSQDFSSQQQHLSGGDIAYEAVSPAAPPVHQSQQQSQQENTTPAHMENSSFSVAQFPGFANLAAEQVQAMVDKFQESDYHLKLDPMRGVLPQSNTSSQDASTLPFHHGGGGQRQQHTKTSKETSSSSSNLMQSLQMNQNQQQSSPVAFSHLQPTANISHSSHQPPTAHSVALTLSSMQQQQTQPTVQAPADSTTKPKRVRNRKKKTDVPASATSTPTTPNISHNSKKPLSIPQTSPGPPSVQQRQQHPNMSTIPPMASATPLSNLSMPHSPHIGRDNQHHQQQQQQIFSPSANQFTNRDAQRSQTPSMPQNYSMNDTHAFSHSPSPKIQTPNPSMMMAQHNDFNNMAAGRVSNDKSNNATYNNNNTSNTTASTKRQRKQKQPSQSSNTNSNNNNNSRANQNSQSLYMSNIPGNNQQMSLQQAAFTNPSNMMNMSSHIDTPIRTSNNNSSGNNGHRGGTSSHTSRMGNFPGMPGQQQTSLDASSVSNLGQQQPSPQDSKQLNHHPSAAATSHYLNNSNIITMQQQPPPSLVSDTRPQQQHSSQPQSPSLNSQQPLVMSQAPPQTNYDPNRGTALIIDGSDPNNQFQVDFGQQPFFDQLVSAQNPNFPQTATTENGEEVILTTLVSQGEQQQQQQHQLPLKQEPGTDHTAFRPTYHGAAVHEIHPVASFDDGMAVGEMGFDQGYNNGMGAGQQQQGYQDYGKVEVEPMTLTFMPSVEEDEEFNHFSLEPSVAVVKQEHGQPTSSTKKDNFQDSFLSYLQGNKQETLSSVSSSAITKKPQLPKYIPEPRRPRPPPPPPQPVTVLQKDPAPSASHGDDSDDVMFVSSHGSKDFLSTLSDNDNSSQNSDKEGYTVQRTSELAMKITLPKGKKRGKVSTLSESALLSHNKKQQQQKEIKVKRKRGKLVDSDGEPIGDGDDPRQPSPPLVRTSIGRKAKERVNEKAKKKRKYADSGSSSEDDIFVRKTGLDDKDYDSDKDPVWSPFDTDLKVGYDVVEKKKKPKRIKLRSPARIPPPSLPRPGTNAAQPYTHKTVMPPTKFSGQAIQPSSNKPTHPTQSPAPSGVTNTQATGSYPLGQYLIEKKDLQNYESYPIWRLEPSNMIHKYELVMQEGVIRHKAVGTYSTWMKSMYDLFEPIKVKELVVKGKSESVLVQVRDEYQPKVPTDGKLIQQYEDDPLVESFNIYLQVFISQALEPTFLKAILDMGESFYLDPLNDIDNLVEGKVKDLAALAQWKASFQDVLHRCPLMKEIDRPNLKQACQACENSSPPTIKSVLLSGQSYDRTLLTAKQGSSTDTAQEFMIGKVAANYVRPYHSLYHFKHWLQSRCEAKVKVMMESDRSLTGENILDKCLENRTWVLQLFDNFKKLLAFGTDTAR